METLPSPSAMILTVFLSLLSSYLFFKYLRLRAQRIKRNILALDEHEAFLERISKGNIALIRVGFAFISTILGFVCASASLFILALVFPPSSQIRLYLYAISGGLMIAGIYSCFDFSRSIMKLRDLSGTKQLLQKKREKLQSRLE